jgi:hypothetical protein
VSLDELADLLRRANEAWLEMTDEDGWYAVAYPYGRGSAIAWSHPRQSGVLIHLRSSSDGTGARQLELEVKQPDRTMTWLTREGQGPFQRGVAWSEWTSVVRLPFQDQLWALVQQRCAQVSKHLDGGLIGLNGVLGELRSMPIVPRLVES